MKKTYSKPRFYFESFEMHPIIGTECGEGIFFMEDVMKYKDGKVSRDQLLSWIVYGSGEELILNHADSWNCYGYSLEMPTGSISGPYEMFTTFHTKNGGASACAQANLESVEGLEYPIWGTVNVCYHIPLYQLLTFASV